MKIGGRESDIKPARKWVFCVVNDLGFGFGEILLGFLERRALSVGTRQLFNEAYISLRYFLEHSR